MPSRLHSASLGTWLIAAALLVPAPSGAVQMFDFALVGEEAPETEASFMRPQDGFISFYNIGTVLTLELPTDPIFGQLTSGVATLGAVVAPAPIDEPIQGMYFELNNVPSSVTGTFTINDNGTPGDTSDDFGELDFPSFQVGFRRGTTEGNAQQGNLDFALTSGTQTVTNCGGRGSPGQDFTGQHIDLSGLAAGSSALSLVGTQCPYGPTGDETLHDNVFRLTFQGFVPEPSTGLLLGFGLAALGLRSRRR